jgi:hypothetical protein
MPDYVAAAATVAVWLLVALAVIELLARRR